MDLIIGNLCSILAMITDSVSSTRKTPREVLTVQNLSQIIYGLGAVILKGYSAAVQNFVSLLRNLAAIRGIKNKWVEWGLVALGVVLGLVFNNRGLMGLLPVIANLEYSIAVFRCQDNERLLKAAFLVCVVLFAIFNLAILNFVGFVSNLAVAFMTGIALLKKVT